MKGSRWCVRLFDEVDKCESESLGGKAAGLVRMTQMNLPIPPGFVVGTSVCRAYLQEGKLPGRLAWQIRRGIKELEKRTGKQLGDSESPLLLAVRSGAAQSMPGMMETILNLGIDDAVRQRLSEENRDEQYGWKLYERFLRDWATAVAGIPAKQIDACLSDDVVSNCFYLEGRLNTAGFPVPKKPMEQLMVAVEAVCNSWNSERAVSYRRSFGISNNRGTAVTIQMMVLGNLDNTSGTGVVFSRDVNTGAKGVTGEYMCHVQGQDVVGGSSTPNDISLLAQSDPGSWKKLCGYMKRLEQEYRDVVDVEFTIESGRLWLLQCRGVKRPSLAAVQIASDLVQEGLWPSRKAIHEVAHVLETTGINALQVERFADTSGMIVIAQGIPASSGVVWGQVARTADELYQFKAEGKKVILLREETSPDDFDLMRQADAIVTARGGNTCHAAVVARSLAIPAVVGCGLKVCFGTQIGGPDMAVDGKAGIVYQLSPHTRPIVEKVVVLDHEAQRLVERAQNLKLLPRINWSLTANTVDVDVEFVNFYVLLNLLRQELKTACREEVLQAWQKVRNSLADTFATYLALAIAAEIRHVIDCPKADQKALGWMRQRMPETANSRNQWQQAVMELPVSDIPKFAKCAADLFESTHGFRSGYGGKPWATIARTLYEGITGSTPVVVFVDRVFDLRHNGNRLFDKHHMVRSYEPLLDELLALRAVCSGQPWDLLRQCRQCRRAASRGEWLWGSTAGKIEALVNEVGHEM